MPNDPPDPNDKVQLVSFGQTKANAIDGALLDALGRELDRAKQEGARAVVLTGYDKYFSAGLNLRSLPSDRDGMLRFLQAFERQLLDLATFPLPVVAAINGHAVAGGCIFAAACDVRVAAEGSYRIGLSEVDLGVPFPRAALEILRPAILPTWLTDLVLGARMLSPEEARTAGLVHAVVPASELLSEATTRARALGAKPQPAFKLTKEALREDMVARMGASADAARQAFVDCWFSAEVTERRAALLAR